MKKVIILLLTGMIILFIGCTPLEPTDDPGPKTLESYEVLLKKVKDFDRNINFTDLRMAYCKSDLYNPYEMHLNEKKQMNKAIQEKRYNDAIKIAEGILEKDYLDIESHFACMIAFKELENSAKFEYHSFVAEGLVNSILDSGDGKSFKTAYKVINVREEYIALNMLGYKQKEQCCVEKNGHRYDVLTVVNLATKKEEKIYFNIDIPFGVKIE